MIWDYIPDTWTPAGTILAHVSCALDPLWNWCALQSRKRVWRQRKWGNPENLGKSTAKALVGSEERVIELSNFICPTK